MESTYVYMYTSAYKYKWVSALRKIYGVFNDSLYFPEGTTICYGYINLEKYNINYYSRFNYIITILTIKYGSNYYNTFTMDFVVTTMVFLVWEVYRYV